MRIPLIGLAAAVVAGIAGLVLLMSGGDEGPARAAAPAAAGSDAGAARAPSPEPFPPAEPPPASGEEEPREVPELASASDPGDLDDEVEPAYREYRREDGALVRDHRKDAAEREPSFGGISDPRQLPPTAEKVQPQTVLALRNAIRPAVRRCAREHAPDADAGSAISARVTFTVASETLTVDDVSTRSRGLADASGLGGCVEAAAKDVSLAVAGAEDVEGHPVSLPFRIGPAR